MTEKSSKTSFSRALGVRILSGLESLSARYPLAVNIAAHTVLFTISLLLAYLLRFDVGLGSTRETWSVDFFSCLPFFLGLKLLLFGRLRLLRSGWQYAGIRDVVNILLAAWFFMLIGFVLVYVFRDIPVELGRIPVPYVGDYFKHLPRGVLVLDFLMTVFLVCTARLGFRLYREELRPVAPEGFRRVLIIGAGNAAESIIREIHRMPVERYRVVGLVDDDPGKQNLVIHGVPVLGTTEEINHICEEEDIQEIIIAMPSATQKQLRRVIDLCSGTKLNFQSLPSMGDLINGRVTVSQIRPVDINDLLGREAVELDTESLARFLRNRRVLITGAGGSIGSEMCRQVSNYGPARLILVEQAETPLFEIENELLAKFPDIPVDACICDIYDRDRVMYVWDAHRPEVVIHAAAHKHVPLMERNPSEAIKNNILGTKNVADASCKYGSAEFVMISTDKAVNPSSVMGASKRIAEIYTQTLNGQPGCKTQFKAVRFGNVLGSAGSVVPIFRRQIAEGGPVRVTHPEMRRYFMTIPEAAQLVLQASATGTGGQIYLLDMGEPVKIVDLARQMITLSGFRPDADIDIVFTGIRPGEKLFEELRTDTEEMEPTVHSKIVVWKSQPTRWEEVQEAIGKLAALENCSTRKTIIDAMREIVPEYQPEQPAGFRQPSQTMTRGQAQSSS